MFLFFFVVARGHRDRYARWLFYSPCKTGGPAAHSAGTGCTQALRAAYAPTRGVDGSKRPAKTVGGLLPAHPIRPASMEAGRVAEANWEHLNQNAYGGHINTHYCISAF